MGIIVTAMTKNAPAHQTATADAKSEAKVAPEQGKTRS